jgi:hypothetical protein
MVSPVIVQEFRSSGVQEFRSSGVQEFRSSGAIGETKRPQKIKLFCSILLCNECAGKSVCGVAPRDREWKETDSPIYSAKIEKLKSKNTACT